MTCDKHDIEIHGLPGEKEFCCTCECEKNLRNKITAKDAKLVALKKTVNEIAELNEKANDEAIKRQAIARKLAEELVVYAGSDFRSAENWLELAQEVTG